MIRTVLLIALLGFGCDSSSAETKDFQKLARAINGSVRALRPTWQAIATIKDRDDSASVVAVIEMSASVRGPLAVIEAHRPDFHDLDHRAGGPDFSVTDAPTEARAIQEGDANCSRVGEEQQLRCRSFLVERWSSLAASFDKLRARADRLGVHLESLTGVE
jgi:hypothetical protein